MRNSHLVLMAALLYHVSPSLAGPAESPGVGILGDSYSDEYRFYPPDRPTARNWVEILAETRAVNFGRFSTSSRGEPRNEGYEYNWARSDATTDDMIATGQHTGLAAQVARGEVQFVVIFVGGNDFINAMKSSRPLAALERTLPRAIANFRTAVETIRAAHPEVRLLLGTVPDIRNLPEFTTPIRNGSIPRSVADAFTAAIDQYNVQIRACGARDARVAVLDLELATKLASRINPDYFYASGRKLDRIHPSNHPLHFFLADSRHPGTLGQALMAQVFIETLNVRFNARVRPLSGREVLRIAGLEPVLASSPSPSPASRTRDASVTRASATSVERP
jgi:lysophospholipase L1-like esterase